MHWPTLKASHKTLIPRGFQPLLHSPSEALPLGLRNSFPLPVGLPSTLPQTPCSLIQQCCPSAASIPFPSSSTHATLGRI